MTTEALATLYDRIGREEQARFLARLLHALTIAVRACYSERPQRVTSRPWSPVAALNETMHLAAEFLVAVLCGGQHRADGRAVIDSLDIQASAGRAEVLFRWALGRAAGKIGTANAGSNEAPLTVLPNGLIVDGNVRIFVLQERGYPVNTLPSEIIPYPSGGSYGDSTTKEQIQ